MSDFTSYKLDDLSYGLDINFDGNNLEFNDSEHSIVIPFAASISRDRSGDFLECSGILTENHQKNPVSFLDHGKLGVSKPIGKCQSPDGEYTVTITDTLAIAKIYLATGIPDFPDPEICYHLYKGGFLKSGSIGYRPLEVEVMQPDPANGYFQKANWLKRTELQEVSLVGLPMNQDCVKSLLAAGVYEGMPLTSEQKYLLRQTPKIYSNGIDINMTKAAMSANDQSQGGAFRPPAGSLDQTQKLLKAIKAIIEEHEKDLVQGRSEEVISENIRKERHAGKPEAQAVAIAEHEAHKSYEGNWKVEHDKLGYWAVEGTGAKKGPFDTEDEAKKYADQCTDKYMKKEKMLTKAADKPDVEVEPEENAKSVMQNCKEHLMDASGHADTPDDLRVEHASYVKEISDAMDKPEESEESHDDKPDEEAKPESFDDLDLMRRTKEHLETAAQREDIPKMMKDAHSYHADCIGKCMGKDMDEEPEFDEHEEKMVMKFLKGVETKLSNCNKKIYTIFGK